MFPFNKFPGVDPILGPEMKSTGEVMGAGKTFGEAFFKAQLGAGATIASEGVAFLSVRDADKDGVVSVAKALIECGFSLVSTRGTCRVLKDAGVDVKRVNKVNEGRPHIVDMIKNDEIDLIVNTTDGAQAIKDSADIRRSALQHKVYYTTTLAGAEAVVEALKSEGLNEVRRLQELHASV